jgi:hypothetical protein
VADFQQFYNLDVLALAQELEGDETTATIERLATLCAQLPRESRLMRATSPALEWSDETYLLSRCEYLLRCIQWMLSEDGAKGANRPQPMPTPVQVAEDTRAAEATDFAYIDAMLRGVTGGV